MVLAPLVPLLLDDHHYPQDYSLPKRKRNKDALDIPKLITTFRKSLLYEEKSIIPDDTQNINDKKNRRQINERRKSSIDNEGDNIIHSDLAILGVLSPYSLLPHVMIIELSEKRYLQGPESVNETEWLKISDLAKILIISMKKTNDDQHKNQHSLQYVAQCCGFNWSPFAWGKLEERMSCQSIVTKFHMMIWQWSFSDLTDNYNQKIKIPEVKQQFFFKNQYNALFGKLILKELGISTYSSAVCGPRGVFIPFDVLEKKNDTNQNIQIEDNIKKLRNIAIVVEKIIMH